jgi:hypothetical protein
MMPIVTEPKKKPSNFLLCAVRPTVEEQRIYYRSVLKAPPPADRLQFVTACIFRPHSDGLRIDLENLKWCCPGCGSGNIFELEGRRPWRNRKLSPWDAFWNIVGEGKEKVLSLAGSGGTIRAPVELTTLEAYESPRVVALIRRHRGKDRRYLQRSAHLPAGRFARIMRFVEQENEITHEDRPSTGGRWRRLYFPVHRPRPPVRPIQGSNGESVEAACQMN